MRPYGGTSGKAGIVRYPEPMASILRVVTKWEGFNGAPGYTNLFFRDFGVGGVDGGDPTAEAAQSAVERVRDFWDGIKVVFPNEVRLQIQSDVDLLEDTNGQLQDSFGVDGGAPITGTNATNFSGPVGAVINWKTAGIREGRRIRGRTFLVPLAHNCFGEGGSVNAQDAGFLANAAATLAAPGGTPDLGIWARPTAKGASDGKWAPVTSSNVPTLAAVLRSRRD